LYKIEPLYLFLYGLFKMNSTNIYENDAEFDEIDSLLMKIQQQNEIDDFINRGVYPERLQSKYSASLTVKPLISRCIDDTVVTVLNTPEYKPSIVSVSDVYYITRRIHNKLASLEDELQILNLVVNKTETCPICIERIDYNNCVHPSCGHCICLPCFTQNIRQNEYTSHLCSVCRSNLLL